ncbi:MAG: Gfo/Idh/MocA family oxidoreductase [Acholeplasmataceae bacterium]|nr:Gfo/Idh/MocA family oxidoreductase [Acholeplasmataceae bacterium]
MEAFRWCFIGTGGIAHTVAKVIIPTGRHQIVSVWNRTVSKAEKFAKKYNATVYPTAEEAILAHGVDGVYIALTADQHEAYTLLALNLKKPVLCEKPFAPNQLSALRMFEASKLNNMYLGEAMWTWFSNTSIEVKKWISSNMIGDIVSASLWFSVPIARFSKSSRLRDPNKCGGALLDVGVYPIRYAYELFGMPKSIQTLGDVHNGIDYGETVYLNYPEFQVKVQSSIMKYKGEHVTIHGTKGTIQIPYFHVAKKAILKKKGMKKIYINPDGKGTQLLIPQFDKVASEIKSGIIESAWVTPKSTLDTQILLDECRRQMVLFFPFEKN